MVRVGSGDGVGQDLPYQDCRYHLWSVGLVKLGRLFVADILWMLIYPD
jgi:hypothetical protein